MFTHFFIDRPILSAVLSILIVLAGLVSLSVSPIEQYPDMAPPQVTIDARYPGATAEVIANNVAAPIEAQLNGIDNLLYFYSNSSSSGNVQIVVVFKPGSNPDINQVNVHNRLSQATPQIPQVVVQQGITVESARAALAQVCEAQDYVLESKVVEQLKDLLDTLACLLHANGAREEALNGTRRWDVDGFIEVRAPDKMDAHLAAPLRRAGGDLLHAGHARHGSLYRLGDQGLDIGGGYVSGVGRDGHHRQGHIRHQVDGDPLKGHRSEENHDERGHGSGDGAANGDFRQAQHRPWMAGWEFRGGTSHAARMTGERAEHFEGWVEDFDDEVFCASVPNTLLIVRRCGKVTVSGNSEAGTALRGAIARLLAPTNQVTEALDRLGVDVVDSSGNLLMLTDIIRNLEEADATTADMMTIFGLEAGPAMQALVSQGADALGDLATKLVDSGGTAARIANEQMKGLNGALKSLRSAVEGLAIAIAESGLLDWAEQLVDHVTELVRGLSDLNPDLLRWGIRLADDELAAIEPRTTSQAAAINAIAIKQDRNIS